MASRPLNQRRKWLRGILITLVILTVTGSGLFLRRVSVLKSEFADFILQNPAHTAVAAYTFDHNGDLIDDGYTIFHNADQPLGLASTVKLAVLAAYAEAAASGDLDPQERIPVADWEKYYIPYTDGGAHAKGLKSAGLKADDHGFAVDQAATVSLDDVARTMIHYSGNAATDYLIFRIGRERVNALLPRIGLADHPPIHSASGPILTLFDHEHASPSLDYLQPIVDQSSDTRAVYMNALIDRYITDPDWRRAQIAFMSDQNNPAWEVTQEEMLAYQKASAPLLAAGTARGYARMLALAATGNLISSEVSAIMQNFIENVPGDELLRLAYFDRFGAKDGVIPGILTIASYAVPTRGPLAGQSRVVVVFANQLDLRPWLAQLTLSGHYLIQTDLARGKGIFSQLLSSP